MWIKQILSNTCMTYDVEAFSEHILSTLIMYNVTYVEDNCGPVTIKDNHKWYSQRITQYNIIANYEGIKFVLQLTFDDGCMCTVQFECTHKFDFDCFTLDQVKF